MSVSNSEESEFEKQGVEFKIITEEMYEDVKNFYWKHFIPEEPMTRLKFLEIFLYHYLIHDSLDLWV